MTVKTTYSYEEFQGNDVAKSFPFDFPFFKKDDINVTEIDQDDNEKVLVYGQDYDIPGVRWYNGGQIDLIGEPLPTGYKLLVERLVDETQEFAVRNTGNFNPSSHEDAYDKLTMIIQQVVYRGSNALQLNKSKTEWQTRDKPFDQVTSNGPVEAPHGIFESLNVNDSATIQDLTVDKINVDLVNVKDQNVENQTVENLTVNNKAEINRLNFTGDADANNNRIRNLPAPLDPDEPLRKQDVADISEAPSFEYVDEIVGKVREKVDFIKTQPSIPPHTDSPKLVMRPSGESGFWLVSKRSRNRGGFIMTLVRDDVANADDLNTGGASNTRPSVVNNCPYVYVANSVASNKVGDVTQPSVSDDFIDSVWRFFDDGTSYSYFSESEDTSESNLKDRKLYNVNSGSGNDYVEFRTRGDCTLHLGSSATSSETVDIQLTTESGSVIHTIYQLNLRQTGSNPSIGQTVDIKTPFGNRFAYYRVRVINRSVNVNEPCYVAGLNILLLDETTPTTYITNAYALRSTPAPRYRQSSGANEFAAKEADGKFFGTFHGGHDQFFERLRTDNGANFDIKNDAVPNLLLTQHCTLYSKSRLKPDSGTMSFDYLLTTRFADGLDVSTQSLIITGGFPPVCSDVYTHMCATDTSFTYIYQPIYMESIDSTNTPVGDVQTIEQYRASGGLTMATFFTRVDVTNNNQNGAYIQKTSNFHKQYYGPILGKDFAFDGGTYITVKEYF